MTYKSEFSKDQSQMWSSNPLQLIFQEIDVNENIGDSILIHHWNVTACQKILQLFSVSAKGDWK
jgi:hypothetical protein